MPVPRLFRALLLFALLPGPALACGGTLHVEIEHTGAYTLDHASIAIAQPGLADCSVNDLVLTHRGEAVPIRVVDDGDGRFGPGDRIEWLGRQLHGPMSWFNAFSINNVYLLSAEPGAQVAMRDATAAEGGASAALERVMHLEQESMLIRLDQSLHTPGEEPDVWQWVKLTHADPAPFTHEFELADLDPRAGPVAMTVNFRGLSKIFKPYTHATLELPDHSVDVRVNGQRVRALHWDGREEISMDLVVAAGILKPGRNTLELAVSKRGLPWGRPDEPLVDVVMFNWVKLRFPIAGNLDASPLPLRPSADSARTVSLTWSGEGSPVLYGDDGVRRPGLSRGNARFDFAAASAQTTLYPAIDGRLAAPVLVRAVAASEWRAPAQGYDYLIVSHARLIDAIRPLGAFHEKRGLKVAVIDVQDVYDGFNDGITHPQAIRNLVAHAHAHWPEPHPRFLLLVGDASFDIRNNTEDDLRYAKFANNMHELAYSGHFAGIAGTSYGEGATMFAGRNLIPTWQFPSPEGQSASDNPYAIIGDGYHPTLAVGRFPVVEPAEVSAIVDKTIDYMSKPQPGNWRRDVMFITDESDHFKKTSDELADSIGAQGFVADRIYASKDEADNLAHQSAIKDGLNQGQLLVHFIGHGGRYIWRTGPPDIRKNHDLFTLDDVSGLTNSGRLPMILSMTCYSAPFDNPSEDSIGERFLREADKGAVAVFAASWRNAPSTVFSKNLIGELLTPGATIGEGIVRAKRSINDRILVEMYNLLGDPAVVLERPRDAAQVVRDDNTWNPGLIVALPGTRFDGRVDVEWFDESGARIAVSSLHVSEPRFRLGLPTFDDGRLASTVRIYSSDLRSGRDAAGMLDLAAPALAGPPRWKWPAWLARKPAGEKAETETEAMVLPPRPRAADTISQGGFENHEAPTLVAGN